MRISIFFMCVALRTTKASPAFIFIADEQRSNPAPRAPRNPPASMCIISRAPEAVALAAPTRISNTKIFAMASEDGASQLTMYANQCTSTHSAIMVLPVPTRNQTMVEVRVLPTSNVDVFKLLKDRMDPARGDCRYMSYREDTAAKQPLAVKEAGSYRYTVVPGLDALDRIPEEFWLEPAAVAFLRKYYGGSYAFLLCKLMPGKDYTPLLYESSTPEPYSVFLPMRHFHDGEGRTDWDHELYVGMAQYDPYGRILRPELKARFPGKALDFDHQDRMTWEASSFHSWESVPSVFGKKSQVTVFDLLFKDRLREATRLGNAGAPYDELTYHIKNVYARECNDRRLCYKRIPPGSQLASDDFVARHAAVDCRQSVGPGSVVMQVHDQEYRWRHEPDMDSDDNVDLARRRLNKELARLERAADAQARAESERARWASAPALPDGEPTP